MGKMGSKLFYHIHGALEATHANT